MTKAKVGIVGGAGYTAGELIRILLNHPQAEIGWVHSQSQGGKPVTTVHQDLLGEIELAFTAELDWSVIDILFLCSGHGASQAFLQENTVPDSIRIVDLSQDFRLADPSHNYVYGLPELNKNQIKETSWVANPGCFATCIQLGILPLAHAGLLSDDVHIHAITGSTGAGQKPTATSHFSWRNNNISVYKAFRHQHLREINQSLLSLQPNYSAKLNFLPVRGNFTRGIFASLYTAVSIKLEEAQELYRQFYEDSPFVFVAETHPHLKQVVNTNKGIIYLEQHDDTLLIISMIDNLLKGASGQAVQNMNLMMGWDETAGLRLKSSMF
ncbi:N-acetyl-gamma-glutamyl-phosphate reductase [Tunicatimonas pelagia]|uniref:N-acetyl-gamma-glutamyl-phosphate reductase n=1 Tax=Tunicatimonas pelagia TaxID=931531 RepID=UPI0026658DBE|nr:N-acetyl-gamma-glutamyl-phosphate reductase [Tunicatimonas pelagia]WKN43113.1 N-acetyl-gamma-glutamyl-phosphate reductase [Tunicatimonas pelagia]